MTEWCLLTEYLNILKLLLRVLDLKGASKTANTRNNKKKKKEHHLDMCTQTFKE